MDFAEFGDLTRRTKILKVEAEKLLRDKLITETAFENLMEHISQIIYKKFKEMIYEVLGTKVEDNIDGE